MNSSNSSGATTSAARSSLGQLEAIWLKTAHRGPMAAVTQATLVAGRGMQGNANQGGKRQVTILEREVWEALMNEAGGTLPPETRRANLLISRLSVAHSTGRILRIGECRIRILGETEPCSQMDRALPGLRVAMLPDWRGGAFGEVLDGGSIGVGDSVSWDDGG